MKHMNSRFASDSGETPAIRIFAERPVFENDDLFVVKDIDPISNTHYLLMSKRKTPSLADTFGQSPARLSIAQIATTLGLSEWMMYERGRAPFCTSMNTDHHAHAHLFDLKEFSPSTTRELKLYFDTKHLDISQAISSLCLNDKQYVLMGDSSGEWNTAFAPCKLLEEKRAIRGFLSTRTLSEV